MIHDTQQHEHMIWTDLRLHLIECHGGEDAVIRRVHPVLAVVRADARYTWALTQLEARKIAVSEDATTGEVFRAALHELDHRRDELRGGEARRIALGLS